MAAPADEGSQRTQSEEPQTGQNSILPALSASSSSSAASSADEAQDEALEDALASSDAEAYDALMSPADEAPLADDAEGALLDEEPPEGAGVDLSTSTLEVEIIDARPYMVRAGDAIGTEDAEFSLNLSGLSAPLHQKLVKGSDGAFAARFTVPGLSNGTYTLSIQSSKFAPYEHANLDLTGGMFRMTLYAGEPPVGVEGVGNIQYGSLTGTSVGQADVDQLIGTIEKTNEADSDLNRDNATTLLDLQILAEAMGKQSVFANLRSSVTTGGNGTTGDMDDDLGDEVMASTTGNVKTSDSTLSVTEALTKLLDNFGGSGGDEPDHTVGLSPADGGAISESNPVELTFDNLQNALTASNITNNGNENNDMVDPDSGVIVEGVAIKTPVVDNAGTGQTSEGMVAAYYDDENGREQVISVGFNSEKAVGQQALPAARTVGGTLQAGTVKAAGRILGDTAGATAAEVSNGVITVNFGKRIAIKRITITVTKVQAVSGDFTLAEISSVQFLNNMADAVQPPDMNIPTLGALTPGSKQFTVNWSRESNVTGYEICVEDKAKNKQQIFFVSGQNATSKVISSFIGGNKGKLENGVTYTVKVQSANGSWRSGWSAEKTVKPEAAKAPDAPENVKAVGGYRYITVSWPAPEDAESYTLYYRVKGTSSWESVTGITNLSYTLQNLPDYTTYELYLTATNLKGTSGNSAVHEATTTSVTAAKLPNYLLLNTQDSSGAYFTHITDATIAATGYTVNDSEVDTARNGALCLFDGKFESNIQISDWDLGTSYNQYNHGVKVTFDSPQKIGMISFAAAVDNIGYRGVKVRINGNEFVNGCTISLRDGGNGRKYSLIKLPREVEASEILIGVNRVDGGRGINMAEMRFHGYNTIEDEIDALYDNSQPEYKDMRMKLLAKWHEPAGSDGKLAGDVEIARLEAKATEQSNGEDYPFKSIVQAEIAYAKQLLEDEKAGEVNDSIQAIHTDLADAYDANKNLGISGLNAWQPLGRVAHEGEDIIIYVNAPNSTASKSKIDLYIGQKYGTASYAPKRVGTFATGRTMFTIPSNVFSSEGGASEHGGRLYAVYTGNNPNEQWSVRILGAQKIPTLDLFRVTDTAEREKRVKAYVDELNAYIGTIKDIHTNHAPNADAQYSDRYCVANSTDIMLDRIMFSVPAKQAKAACSGNADNLLAACDGADQMMQLFYQHKGLMDAGAGVDAKNTAPVRHLNIRCMQMTGGAFMYAAGNHIGVGYNEAKNFGMLRANTHTAASSGAFDGTYFGWGTAHEIGHNINDSRYVVAEVTNNYFAQICSNAKTNGDYVRWGSGFHNDYTKVFDRVTSGVMGSAGGVGTQLAMYWQLALAFDNHEIYTMYNTYDDLFKNRFFARVDSYARNPSQVSGLAVDGGTQQNIVRLASAAAGKDLSEYFLAWGIAPDAQTQAFLGTLPKEERAIQYATEATANRELVDGTLSLAAHSFKGAAAEDVFTVSPVASVGDHTGFTITPTAAAKDKVHGFEVSRITYSKGKQTAPQVMKFIAEPDENGSYVFSDDAAGMGNRMVRYQIQAIDKCLYRSGSMQTADVKMRGTGYYDPSGFSVDTNMVQRAGAEPDIDGDDVAAPDFDSVVDGLCEEGQTDAYRSALLAVMTDGADAETFIGHTKDAGDDPYIIVDMGQVQPVEHIEYTLPDPARSLYKYELYLSTDGEDWGEPVSTGDVLPTGGADYETRTGAIYMEVPDSAEGNGYICTVNARYVKIVALGQGGENKDISISRLAVYGPSGDNIELGTTDTEGASSADSVFAGILESDFAYDSENPDAKIKAGSLVFLGEFKGNPAYNQVMLYDQDGVVVGGTEMGTDKDGNEVEVLKATQIILAPRPDDKGIRDTWDGRWIYWIEPEDVAGLDLKKVCAELYRVDNAFTSEGERLVSDCGFRSMPSELPKISLKSDGTDQVVPETTPAA